MPIISTRDIDPELRDAFDRWLNDPEDDTDDFGEGIDIDEDDE